MIRESPDKDGDQIAKKLGKEYIYKQEKSQK